MTGSDYDKTASYLGKAADALGLTTTENKRLTKQLADVASYEGAAQRKRIEQLEAALKDLCEAAAHLLANEPKDGVVGGPWLRSEYECAEGVLESAGDSAPDDGEGQSASLSEIDR